MSVATEAAPLMKLRKLPMRCHYQVVELFGNTLPTGDVVAVTETAALKKLGQEMTVDDVMEVAKDVDNDESGDLAIEEFKTLMASLDI